VPASRAQIPSQPDLRHTRPLPWTLRMTLPRSRPAMKPAR
jgi:hypothetical protein